MADLNATVSSGTTGTASGSSTVGQQTGTESSLSNWVGPYVTNMLGQGAALSSQPYQAYTGPLTAGASSLQNQAFQGISGINIPTENMGSYTPQSYTDAGVSQKYMNPYIQTALNPQIEEARRQSEIENLKNRTAATRAGAFGGSRGALMESENQRNLLQNLANVTGQGYQKAYDVGQQQFNAEQQAQQAAKTATNAYGLQALQAQKDAGAAQRDIESQGIAADYAQFQEQRDYPYKQVQFEQSLLQGLPLAAQSYSYAQPSTLSDILSSAGGISQLYDTLFNGTSGSTGSLSDAAKKAGWTIDPTTGIPVAPKTTNQP